MTRMWMVKPQCLCRKHLLGEHKELHQLVGSINKGYSIEGYLNNGLIDPSKVSLRHFQLVIEMVTRGYKHQSNLDNFDCKIENPINVDNNYIELSKRCAECRKRINDFNEVKNNETS